MFIKTKSYVPRDLITSQLKKKTSLRFVKAHQKRFIKNKIILFAHNHMNIIVLKTKIRHTIKV